MDSLEHSALILTTDVINSNLDRRITQQAHLLKKSGWNVLVCGHSSSEGFSIRIENGVTFVGIPASFSKKLQQNLMTNPSRVYRLVFPAARIIWKIYKKIKLNKLVYKLPEAARHFFYLQTNKFRNRIIETDKFQLSGSMPKEVEPKIDLSGSLKNFNFDGHYDLVIACDLTTSEIAIKVANKTGAVLFFDSHEFYSEQKAIEHVKLSLETMEKRIIERADISYFPNPMIARAVQEKYSLGIEINSFTNALNLEICTETIRSAKKDASIPDTQFTILFHGWLSSERNLSGVLEGFAAANRHDLHLLILGFGETSIVTKVTEKYPRANISLLEPVPSQLLPSYIRDINAILIPYEAIDLNHQLAFPNKLGDAIELGIPLIVNENMSFASRAISKYKIGVTANFSDSKSSKEFFLNFNVLKVASHEGFEEARKIYGWTTQESLFLKLIQNSMSAR
jgi:hypothetical protein